MCSTRQSHNMSPVSTIFKSFDCSPGLLIITIWGARCRAWCALLDMMWRPLWWPVVGCQSAHHWSEGLPCERRYHHSTLADSFGVLIEKSMSICASSSPGRLPARLKSPNEAWSRYLIPDSLSQSDFVDEVIRPSGTSGASSKQTMQLVVDLDLFA